MIDRKNVMCPPIEKLIKNKTLPILFIGSGFSKRYIENYPDWRELLYNLAQQIKVSRLEIDNEIKLLEKENKSPGQINKYLGTHLYNKLNMKIRNDELDNILTKEEQSFILENNIQIYKYLIIKNFPKEFLFKKESYLKKELFIFRQLSKKVSTIFTTNFDTFIEELFNNEFKVFIDQSDYFYSENYNCAEIYKIHGCKTKPDSLIFTEEEYEVFTRTAHLTTAKLLTALSNGPIFFIGYSLEDENIKIIFENLLSCLTKEQIKALSKNIIFIKYKKGQVFMPYSTYEFSLNGNKTMPVTYIETDNFTRLFNYINSFQVQATPYEIRRFKELIKHLIDTRSEKLPKIISSSLIEKEATGNSKTAVVAIGKGIESPTRFQSDKIILDALMRSEEYTPEEIFKWTETIFNYNSWVPLYYYLSKPHKYNLLTNEKIKKFINRTNKYFGKLVPNDVNLLIKTNDENELNTKIQKSIKPHEKAEVLMQNLVGGKIKKEIFIKKLQELYNIDNSIIASPTFKKAVTLIDFVDQKKKKA